MASTLVVLAFWLCCLLVWILTVAATSWLAARKGQALKNMSWSVFRGFTAEFFPPGKDHRADT